MLDKILEKIWGIMIAVIAVVTVVVVIGKAIIGAITGG